MVETIKISTQSFPLRVPYRSFLELARPLIDPSTMKRGAESADHAVAASSGVRLAGEDADEGGKESDKAVWSSAVRAVCEGVLPTERVSQVLFGNTKVSVFWLVCWFVCA